MNRIYKIVWSKAKNAYVVTSELAKNHTKSASGKAVKAALAAAVGMGLLMGGYTASAADNTPGAGSGVAIGTGSNAPKEENVAVGKGATIKYSNGASAATGDVAVGSDAVIDNYASQGGSIAIGKNAKIENMTGKQESLFALGQTTYHSGNFWGTLQIPDNPENVAGSIAIGDNTYARTGSIMIGSHNYRGDIGDQSVDTSKTKDYGVNINATTLGTNSFNQGAFSTVSGAYSIISGKYDGSGFSSHVGQNFGATITGSLNSIESATASSRYSGIANSIVGTANRTFNSNGSLIFGAGNEITNSITSITAPSDGGSSAKELSDKLRTAVKNSNSGGATLAIGGGNTADWTQLSQIIGVNNTLKGESGAISKFNMIDGYKNTVTKAEHVSVIGSENTVENSKSQTVIGDSNKITDRNAGTVSGKQEERTKNVSDLVIGKGNDISGNDTYMKGYESLTVIGNNNKAVNPSSSIVIGDNQKLSAIKESVVIGSMTPEEKADPDIGQKHASVVVGYHAQSGTRDGGGMNVALGHGAKAYGWQETVTGIKSIVEAGSGHDGYLASVYGGLNTVASNKADQNDGMANTVVGTLNKTEGANGALVFGAGNSVTHSFGTAPTDEDGNSMNEHWSDAILGGGQKYAMGEGPLGHDELRKAMGLAMSTGGGSVVTMGNGNTSDYAVHSQIIGSGNILTGTANTPSINNTINGYANTGRNVERVSMMGTGNNISDGTADVVIGDYHHMDGGKNNVILGSMATEKKTVEKTYTMKDASGNVILEKKYKVMENVPIKSHTANISNAVMLGYNTDVEKDGGVAIGADSVASVDKGVIGYDASGTDHSNDTTGVWKSTAAAVSVGKEATPTSAAVTRQITNVAAGTQDTDAVNVAQLKKVQAAAGAAKVHYYSAKSTKTGAGSNYDNDGAEAEDSIVLGISSSSKGVNSTVLGNNNKLTGVKNGRNNSIVAGQNLDVEGAHNAVFGTDYNNYDHKLTKVFGEQNTVIGVGNLVGYTAEKDPSDPTKWIYTKNSSGSDQNVAVGMKNTVNGASVVVGADSEAEGIGASFGRGNKVIGPDNGGGYRGLALGNNLTVKGEEAVAVGTNASATADWAIAMGSESKAEKENAMAFGYASHAKVVGGVALGAWSVADRAGGVSGYDPSTKAASTDTSATWKATAAAVSVGDSTGNTKITRQITNVAAGSEDTDAVNVAQLKKVEAKAAEAEKKHTTVKAGDYVTVTEDTNGDGGKEYTISGPKMESTDGTVKITDKVENGKKVGYNLSVNTSSLGIEKTEVTAGENVTVTSKKDGNKTTYTINAKDTVVTGGTASYAADGKGTATLTNNDGSTATITGLRDLYTTSAALDGNTLNFTRNDGSTYSVSGIASSQDIKNVTNKVGELGTRVNRVGAGAAALAALHPLDFDPDDKWDFAAGYGNYKDAHAVSVGAFYRPNEDTMFSVGGSFGGGENMVNAGVSLKLGQGNHVSTSKVAMAKEIVDLRDENKDLKKRLDTMEQKMNSILGILDMGKKKDFPDVPENHWAYEYVATLAGNGIIEGYPDGMFGGDRSMTRYEFAAMFYRALKNGAPVDDNMDRAMNEFEPELRQIRLDRIRVDRISGKDNDRNKVERVRVNSEDDKAKNDYRDVYGSHISPKA